MRSWPATTARRWRRYFSTSPGAARRKPRRERARYASGYCAASHPGDDPALLVPVALVVAAPSGTAVLAGAADHHLGLSADLHRAECRVLRPRRRYPDRRG